MIQKNIKIQIPTGLEARPVAVLVQIASKYESSIFIESGGWAIRSLMPRALWE